MRIHLLSLALAILLNQSLSAQNQYQVLVERPNEKSYKGIISREVIESDTSFKWYAANKKGYTPAAGAVDALKTASDSIQLLTFLGTWCSDSHFIIPRFFSLLDSADFPPNRLTLIGVDRSKKTLSHLTEALGIINVPTIIVYKNGRELGRVVEYGKYGVFDKELAEIIRFPK